MKPLRQRFRHNPEQGTWGDCERAALASILELSLDEVPHFYDKGVSGGEAQRAERDFLLSRGLFPINLAYPGTMSLQDALAASSTLNPGVHYLFGGKSKNGTGHMVVACDGEIVHDPAQDQSGIVGPMDCDEMAGGIWWITFIGSAIALDRKNPVAEAA